jgi:hypothetical protein
VVAVTDFHVPGTQFGDLDPDVLLSPDVCTDCHSDETLSSPYYGWSGSLMGQAGRDPLFFAQLVTANQDVPGVGYYCQRCHVPVAAVTGHALDPTGESLTSTDEVGVSCHLCHTLVDPVNMPGQSPAADAAILAALSDPPSYYGNAMFVLDPTGLRRGPIPPDYARHPALESDFFRRSELCGTCHEVGNLAVSRQADGTYRYNAAGEPAPDANPSAQFPLERTFTEWRLSAFANGGVDMGGRFGGDGFETDGSTDAEPIRTCQDCHMPKTSGAACVVAPPRDAVPRHEFAGAAAWVLQAIGIDSANDPEVIPAALERGIANDQSMLARAATLSLEQAGTTLHVRVINETGHKLPTGHIEGRRMWVHVRLENENGGLLAEYGGYDSDRAELDEASTPVFEMQVGLSDDAARVTGLPSGTTSHMSLADTIVKDNRIPPRGFTNAAYEAAGAPVVGASYADGQYWADLDVPLVSGTTRAKVSVEYQIVSREYIEALQSGNHTNDRGQRLHDLWLATDRAPPFVMANGELAIVLE